MGMNVNQKVLGGNMPSDIRSEGWRAGRAWTRSSSDELG